MRRPHAPGFTNHINIGTLVVIVGVLLAFPLLVLAVDPVSPRYLLAFAAPSAISVVLGVLLFRHFRRDDDVTHLEVNTQIGSLTVLLGWLYGFVAGAAPFVIAGYLGPLHAVFESVSGWTTTGLTVLNVEVVPNVFLFHRALMQFWGGLGFVMVVLVFVHSKQAGNLYSAEGHPDRLAPQLKGSARVILLIYTGFAALGMLAYRVFGMSWFESLVHSMTAISTGGYSTRNASIGAYDSAAIEIVTVVLMLIGSTNFAVLLLLWRGRWRQVSRVSEVRFLGILLTAVSLLVGVLVWADGAGSFGQAVHHAVFNVASAVSGAGFSTVDFDAVPQAALGLYILVMLVGGGSGSTSGGIKLVRVYIMVRVMAHAFRRRMMPVRLVSTPRFTRAQGRGAISEEVVSETTGFALVYLTVFLVGTLVLTVSAGVTLTEGAFEFASALGTVGLSIGVVGAESNAVTIVTAIVGMILGRLEIFIVFIGVYSGWRLSKAKIEEHLTRRAERRVLAPAGTGALPPATAVAPSGVPAEEREPVAVGRL